MNNRRCPAGAAITSRIIQPKRRRTSLCQGRLLLGLRWERPCGPSPARWQLDPNHRGFESSRKMPQGPLAHQGAFPPPDVAHNGGRTPGKSRARLPMLIKLANLVLHLGRIHNPRFAARSPPIAVPALPSRGTSSGRHNRISQPSPPPLHRPPMDILDIPLHESAYRFPSCGIGLSKNP